MNINKNLEDFNQQERDLIMYGSDEIIDVTFVSKNSKTTSKASKQIEGLATLIERRHLSTNSQSARD